MLKKIKFLLFITITALVLPSFVHAQESSNNIIPGTSITYGMRIADLENQYGKHIARIADLESALASASSGAPAMPPTAAPIACAASPARVADLENQYAKHVGIIADLRQRLASGAGSACHSTLGDEQGINLFIARLQQQCNAWMRGDHPPYQNDLKC